MRIDITPPPGPALSPDPKLGEDRSVPALACCKPHPGRFRSLQLPFVTSPFGNLVSLLCQLAVMSIMINTLQTMFSAISRSSFSNFAFSDLMEPTLAGVSWHLGDSEDFRQFRSTIL